LIHFKRFKNVNGQWTKSSKNVHFPKTGFDPTKYMSQYSENSTESEEPQAQGDSQVKTNGDGKNGELTRDVIKTNGMNGHVDKSSNQNNSHNELVNQSNPHTELTNQSNSCTELANQGPARRRQPSYAERETPIYDLFAMTCHRPLKDEKKGVHMGSLGHGHYVAYGKNHRNGNWYLYNDSCTKEVPVGEMDIDQPYILFYIRRDLNVQEFMPNIGADRKKVEVASIDEDYDREIKKYCAVM